MLRGKKMFKNFLFSTCLANIVRPMNNLLTRCKKRRWIIYRIILKMMPMGDKEKQLRVFMNINGFLIIFHKNCLISLCLAR